MRRKDYGFLKNCGERQWFFTEEKEGLVFHRKLFLFHHELWRISAFGVDIGLDLFHRFRKRRFLLHLLFYLLNLVEDGGVIAVSKYLPISSRERFVILRIRYMAI